MNDKNKKTNKLKSSKILTTQLISNKNLNYILSKKKSSSFKIENSNINHINIKTVDFGSKSTINNTSKISFNLKTGLEVCNDNCKINNLKKLVKEQLNKNYSNSIKQRFKSNSILPINNFCKSNISNKTNVYKSNCTSYKNLNKEKDIYLEDYKNMYNKKNDINNNNCNFYNVNNVNNILNNHTSFIKDKFKRYALNNCLKSTNKYKYISNRNYKIFKKLIEYSINKLKQAKILNCPSLYSEVLIKEINNSNRNNDIIELVLENMKEFKKFKNIYGLTNKTLKHIALNCKHLKYNRYEYIYKEGYSSENIYMILKGKVEIFKNKIIEFETLKSKEEFNFDKLTLNNKKTFNKIKKNSFRKTKSLTNEKLETSLFNSNLTKKNTTNNINNSILNNEKNILSKPRNRFFDLLNNCTKDSNKFTSIKKLCLNNLSINNLDNKDNLTVDTNIKSLYRKNSLSYTKYNLFDKSKNNLFNKTLNYKNNILKNLGLSFLKISNININSKNSIGNFNKKANNVNSHVYKEQSAILKEGCIFGEIDLIGSKDRKESAISLEQTHVLVINTKTFNKYLKSNIENAILDRKQFIISTIPYFKKIEQSLTNDIINKFSVEFFDKGSLIINENEIVHSLFIVMKGECKLEKKLNNLETKSCLLYLSKGDIFGLESTSQEVYEYIITSKKDILNQKNKENNCCKIKSKITNKVLDSIKTFDNYEEANLMSETSGVGLLSKYKYSVSTLIDNTVLLKLNIIKSNIIEYSFFEYMQNIFYKKDKMIQKYLNVKQFKNKKITPLYKKDILTIKLDAKKYIKMLNKSSIEYYMSIVKANQSNYSKKTNLLKNYTLNNNFNNNILNLNCNLPKGLNTNTIDNLKSTDNELINFRIESSHKLKINLKNQNSIKFPNQKKDNILNTSRINLNNNTLSTLNSASRVIDNTDFSNNKNANKTINVNTKSLYNIKKMSTNSYIYSTKNCSKHTDIHNYNNNSKIKKLSYLTLEYSKKISTENNYKPTKEEKIAIMLNKNYKLNDILIKKCKFPLFKTRNFNLPLYTNIKKHI